MAAEYFDGGRFDSSNPERDFIQEELADELAEEDIDALVSGVVAQDLIGRALLGRDARIGLEEWPLVDDEMSELADTIGCFPYRRG